MHPVSPDHHPVPILPSEVIDEAIAWRVRYSVDHSTFCASAWSTLDQVKFTVITIALSRQKHLHKGNDGVGYNNVREDGAPAGVQANLDTGHCRSCSDVRRQSITRPSRTYSNSKDETVVDGS